MEQLYIKSNNTAYQAYGTIKLYVENCAKDYDIFDFLLFADFFRPDEKVDKANMRTYIQLTSSSCDNDYIYYKDFLIESHNYAEYKLQFVFKYGFGDDQYYLYSISAQSKCQIQCPPDGDWKPQYPYYIQNIDCGFAKSGQKHRWCQMNETTYTPYWDNIDDSECEKTDFWAIFGAVIGALVLVILVISLCVCNYYRIKKLERQMKPHPDQMRMSALDSHAGRRWDQRAVSQALRANQAYMQAIAPLPTMAPPPASYEEDIMADMLGTLPAVTDMGSFFNAPVYRPNELTDEDNLDDM